MTFLQQTLLLIFTLFNLFIFLKAFYECKYKKNAFGLTPWLGLIGAFVWGDAVVFGLFWFLSGLTALLLQDWILFLLIVSVFWTVRSLGEAIYWFNEQFAVIHRNSPKSLKGFSIFHNDSIWFVYQIVNQCIAVVSIICTIYLAHLWLT